MVKAHPVFGVGAGMFRSNSQLYNPNVETPQLAHNTYLGVAAELGIPGLIIFVSILFLGWKRARRLARLFSQRGDMVNERIARSLEVGLTSFAVAASFLSAGHMRHSWLLIFLVLSIERLIVNQEEQAAQPAPLYPQYQIKQTGQLNLPANSPGYVFQRHSTDPLKGIKSALLGRQGKDRQGQKPPQISRR